MSPQNAAEEKTIRLTGDLYSLSAIRVEDSPEVVQVAGGLSIERSRRERREHARCELYVVEPARHREVAPGAGGLDAVLHGGLGPPSTTW